MTSVSQHDTPREAGPRPSDLEVWTDRDHRDALKAQEVGGRRRKIEGADSAQKSDESEPGLEPDRSSRSYMFFPRTRHLAYELLLGEPPSRVLQNKPPLLSFALHRWLYFWFYVICRIYKAKRLHWMPIARPSIGYRSREARSMIQNVQFNSLKCIASFSKKGGVGKTSVLKALAGMFKHLRRALNVLIQDNNPDRGTLADRGRRTVKHSIMDLLANFADIQTETDFIRYCNEMEEGSLLLASTRPDEFTGELDISTTDFGEVYRLAEDFFNIVFYDCGTDAKSTTNQAALEVADVIQLYSTPAKDSIYQAVMSYVWMCKHPQLRDKHVILVINRRHWWTNLDRIQKFFMDTAAKELEKDKGPWRPSSFTTLGVGWDLRLALGLNFTSLQLRRGVRADLLELLATSVRLMADSFINQPESQLTHQQEKQAQEMLQSEAITHNDVVTAINLGHIQDNLEGKVDSHA